MWIKKWDDGHFCGRKRICGSVGRAEATVRPCLHAESHVWKGEDPEPRATIWVSPGGPGPTYPLQGLLGSTGSWQERAEKPVPKEHPRCLDPLLPLSVDQEHGEALDRRVSTRPLKVRE